MGNLTEKQEAFILEHTVHNEVHAIEMNDDLFDISLKDIEVAAIYVLGQMQHKMVLMQDSSRDWKQVGLFSILEINGKKDPDFSNPEEWDSLTLDSISFSLDSASTWGSSTGTYSSVFHIKEISRFIEQVE